MCETPVGGWGLGHCVAARNAFLSGGVPSVVRRTMREPGCVFFAVWCLCLGPCVQGQMTVAEGTLRVEQCV